MTILRNIVAFLCAPHCLEVEAFSEALEMSQRYKYRFFTEEDAYTFVADWKGPSMMFRIYRRPLFTDKA